MFKTKIIALICSSLMSVSVAFSQDIEQWGTAGVWDVLIDNTLDSGCFIQAEFEDGSLVRIGIDKTEGGGYISVFNEAWGDIEEDTVYPIKFDLDGEMYDGNAKGIYLDNLPGADITFDSEDFFVDIMKKHVMTVFNENGEVLAISLADTNSGLDAVLECQEEVDSSG